MTKYLVTGGCGFIGSHLADLLLQRGSQVVALDDLSTGSYDNVAHLDGNPDFRLVVGSILDEDLTADKIIANTHANERVLLEGQPFLKDRLITITNGYDESDFAEVSATLPTDRFRITYCGSAYGAYNPEPMFRAIERVLKVAPESRMEICIAGNSCKWAERSITNPNIKRVLNLRGYLPHAQIPELLVSSHLLVQSNAAGYPHSVSGKLYEYLRSDTPILAIGDVPSEVDQILRETGHGRCFPHNEIGPMADYIQQVYNCWETGKPLAHKLNAAVAQYDGRVLTGKLALILDEISQKRQAVVPAEKC